MSESRRSVRPSRPRRTTHRDAMGKKVYAVRDQRGLLKNLSTRKPKRKSTKSVSRPRGITPAQARAVALETAYQRVKWCESAIHKINARNDGHAARLAVLEALAVRLKQLDNLTARLSAQEESTHFLRQRERAREERPTEKTDAAFPLEFAAELHDWFVGHRVVAVEPLNATEIAFKFDNRWQLAFQIRELRVDGPETRRPAQPEVTG